MTKVKCKEKELKIAEDQNICRNSRNAKGYCYYTTNRLQSFNALHARTVNSSNSIKMQWRRTTFFFESLIALKNCRQLKKYHFVYYNVVIFCVIAFLHHFDILLWSKCNKAPLRVQHSITAHFLLIILCTAVIRVSCRKA